MTIAQMAVNFDALSSASTWVMAAGISLTAGGLQESIKDLKNGIVQGAKNMLSNTEIGRTASNVIDRLRPAYNPSANAKMSAADMTSRIVGGLQRGLEAGPQESAPSLLTTLKEMAADIGSTALAAAGTCTSTGSTGGFACLQEQPFIQYYFMLIAGVDDEHNGLPLARKTMISNLSGFILCGNTDDFTANCTPAERQAVRGIMEAGFYYE